MFLKKIKRRSFLSLPCIGENTTQYTMADYESNMRSSVARGVPNALRTSAARPSAHPPVDSGHQSPDKSMEFVGSFFFRLGLKGYRRVAFLILMHAEDKAPLELKPGKSCRGILTKCHILSTDTEDKSLLHIWRDGAWDQDFHSPSQSNIKSIRLDFTRA